MLTSPPGLPTGSEPVQGCQALARVTLCIEVGIKIDDNPKRLSEAVHFCNRTKCEVNVLDHMTRQYTTQSASGRWSIYILYNVLYFEDISLWILFREYNASK